MRLSQTQRKGKATSYPLEVAAPEGQADPARGRRPRRGQLHTRPNALKGPDSQLGTFSDIHHRPSQTSRAPAPGGQV